MEDIQLGVLEDGTPYTIPLSTLSQHVYILGKTRTGKSTLLEAMIYADLLAGRSFAVIDPHGRLVKRIADAAGPRTKDIILWDPLAEHQIPTFNPFSEETEEEDATVADNTGMSLEHVYPESWGNRMDDILKCTMRLCIDNKLSLADIPKVLTDPIYRKTLVCSDPEVARFWTDEYDQYSKTDRNTYINPILNKLRPFSTNPILKRAFHGPNALDIPAIMGNPLKEKDGTYTARRAKILLVSLSKRMGPKTSFLPGSMIVTRILQSAYARETIPEEQYPAFTLYIDEFQNFTSAAMADILDEAGKYKLRLVLCHQRRSQVADRNLRDAVLSTPSTLIVFRVGAQDAEELVRELELKDSWGNLKPELLTQLPNYHAYVKTMRGPYPLHAQEIQTIPIELPTGYLKGVQNNTGRRYA